MLLLVVFVEEERRANRADLDGIAERRSRAVRLEDRPTWPCHRSRVFHRGANRRGLRRTVRRGEGRASSVLVHRRARDDRDAVAASNENRATRLRSNVPVGVRVEGLAPPRGREHPRAAEGGVHDGRERETRAGGERRGRGVLSVSSSNGSRRHTRGDQGRGTRGVHGGRGARGAQEERETTARRARFVSRACERARGDSDGVEEDGVIFPRDADEYRETRGDERIRIVATRRLVFRARGVPRGADVHREESLSWVEVRRLGADANARGGDVEGRDDGERVKRAESTPGGKIPRVVQSFRVPTIRRRRGHRVHSARRFVFVAARRRDERRSASSRRRARFYIAERRGVERRGRTTGEFEDARRGARHRRVVEEKRRGEGNLDARRERRAEFYRRERIESRRHQRRVAVERRAAQKRRRLLRHGALRLREIREGRAGRIVVSMPSTDVYSVDAEGFESATVRNSVVSNRLESRVVSNRLANRLGEDASRGDGVRESSRGDAPIERRDGERVRRETRDARRRRRRVRHRRERSESILRFELANAEPGGAGARSGIRRRHPGAGPRAPLRRDHVPSASTRRRGDRLERGVDRGVVGLARGAEERRDGGKRHVRRRRVDVLRRSVRAFRREHRANAAGGLVGDDRVAKRAARAKRDTVRDGSAKMKRRVRRRTVAGDETRRRRGGVLERGKRRFRSTTDASREDDLARVRSR